MSRYIQVLPIVLAIALLATVSFVGCAGGDVEAQSESASSPDVLARVGETEVSRAEVEEIIGAQLMDLERQRAQLVEQALERAIETKVLEIEAEAAGTSSDEMVRARLEGKVAEPTEAEVDAFYEERKDQIRQPKEQIEGQIRNFLKQQGEQEAYQELLVALKAEHGVESYLDPYRVEIEPDGSAPAKGPEGAPVTIVEFSDFECPYCSRLNPTLDQVTETYGDQVRVVFMQFPLPIHANAQKAAEASLCAKDQDMFWPMHDQLFANQKGLALAQLREHAATVGLESEAFNDCLDSGKYASQVSSEMAQGQAVGVSGTPAIFVNGRFLSGAVPFEQIAGIIDDELARAGAGS